MASMGKIKPSLSKFRKICIALDCSPNDVFEFVKEGSEG